MWRLPAGVTARVCHRRSLGKVEKPFLRTTCCRGAIRALAEDLTHSNHSALRSTRLDSHSKLHRTDGPKRTNAEFSGWNEIKGSHWAAQNSGATLRRGAAYMTRTLLIDTDTASDDAVALIMALRSRSVRVAAITVVAGNVPVAQATSNALFTAELCGADVPVYSGAETPLLRKLVVADWFHGVDGLGAHGYKPAKRRAESRHAVDAIIQTVDENPGIEIVTLGPLTNLAMALLRDPKLAASVKRCVVMGGAPCCEGNVTPAAEFNISVDPAPAHFVCGSALPLRMVG